MKWVAPLLALLAACGSTRPSETSERDALHREVEAAVARFKAADPGLARWFEEAYGYAVFPSVAKGGILLGGGYGRGEVYRGGELVGYSTLTQGTIGAQFGAQGFSEVVFFRDRVGFERFCSDAFEFAAQISAVAATAGAADKANYHGGVAVFVLVDAGLMVEAAVGGQKFQFAPK
jgi:lipid-binding SYLF domain-containing protein